MRVWQVSALRKWLWTLWMWVRECPWKECAPFQAHKIHLPKTWGGELVSKEVLWGREYMRGMITAQHHMEALRSGTLRQSSVHTNPSRLSLSNLQNGYGKNLIHRTIVKKASTAFSRSSCHWMWQVEERGTFIFCISFSVSIFLFGYFTAVITWNADRCYTGWSRYRLGFMPPPPPQ